MLGRLEVGRVDDGVLDGNLRHAAAPIGWVDTLPFPVLPTRPVDIRCECTGASASVTVGSTRNPWALLDGPGRYSLFCAYLESCPVGWNVDIVSGHSGMRAIWRRRTGVVFDDQGGRAALKGPTGVLHTALCRQYASGSHGYWDRKLFDEDAAAAVRWLNEHRGLKGIGWLTCSHCRPLSGLRRTDVDATAGTAGGSNDLAGFRGRQGFAGKSVLFSGDGPLQVEELSELLPANAQWSAAEQFAPVRAPIEVDVVVVGEFRYSEEALRAAVRGAKRHMRALPQEGFIDEILFGNNWWVNKVEWLNWMCSRHSGLSFLRSLSMFDWPTTEAVETTGASDRDTEFRSRTRLNELGYQITGLARSDRWGVLTARAVPNLGLELTATTIAQFVRLRKAQRDGRTRYRHAIVEWEYDLSRLKDEYYRGGFIWPSTEPQ